jgi:hypothetical protein
VEANKVTLYFIAFLGGLFLLFQASGRESAGLGGTLVGYALGRTACVVEKGVTKRCAPEILSRPP